MVFLVSRLVMHWQDFYHPKRLCREFLIFRGINELKVDKNHQM